MRIKTLGHSKLRTSVEVKTRHRNYNLWSGLSKLSEGDDIEFNLRDVEERLKSTLKNDDDLTCSTFGLEDENGQVIKVHVSHDEAEEFQEALKQAVAAAKQEHEESGQETDVAEILYQLKDKFEILSIEWPEIEEEEEDFDEEAEDDATGADSDKGFDDSDDPKMNEKDPIDLRNSKNKESGEDEGEGEGDGEPGDESDPSALGGDDTAEDDLGTEIDDSDQQIRDILDKVLDTFKAQSEAKKAEAKAALAKSAELMAKLKLKSEEEALDMEEYYDKQKQEKQESDKLKKLAKFKSEMALTRK